MSDLASPVIDRLGRGIDDLRISVIDRCNFRCSFCMPAGREYEFLPREELLSFEEITRLARLFAGLGVRKLRLTGGEPLLRSQLERLIEMLAAIPGIDEVALTTNGFLLANKAQSLRDAGLSRITVSVPSLDEEIFARINGRDWPLARVLSGIDAARRVGLDPVKVNTVVMRGINDHEVAEIAQFFRARGCVVRFIEFMDVGTLNEWDPEAVVSAEAIERRLSEAFPLERVDRRRPNDVAQRLRALDDGSELGIIASITQPFCGDCTRARLSSAGELFTCLFAAGGVELKPLLRSGASDDAIRGVIADTWSRRTDRYSEVRAARGIGSSSEIVRLGRETKGAGETSKRVEMFRIGG